MKSMKSMMMGGAILLGLTMCLTSCEGTLDDIFGEWSRPTHGTSDGTKPDSQGNVTSISIAPTTLELAAGETGQLTATVDPSGTAVTWSSDKEEVATVDANGLVTAVAAGITTITAKAGDKSATCEVTVTANPAATPLTMEAITAGTIIVNSPKAGMQYSLNGGAKTAVSTTAIDVAVGDKVQFYGNGTSITKYSGTQIAGGTAEVKVYGNIMSLVDETGFATNTTLTAGDTFNGLFKNNAKLTDASGLLLPAETLATSCYESMFQSCKALTAAPELKAKTLANSCYYAMFVNCTSLTAAPALPATSLAENCYYNMFNGCTSLTTAPALPATALANSCYNGMFSYCISLTAAPALPATTLKEECYSAMFQGCKKLTAAPELKAENLANFCYSNMFTDCTSLTAAPALPATTLARNCYYAMFYGCTSLTTAPALPATSLANYCYNYMFQNCTSLITAPAKLPATTLKEDCYSSMFQGCTKLTTAPKLPATSLAKNCYYAMFYNCTALINANVKAAYKTYNGECYSMFYGCSATGAKLHTITTNKDGWQNYLGGGNWTVDNNWTD